MCVCIYIYNIVENLSTPPALLQYSFNTPSALLQHSCTPHHSLTTPSPLLHHSLTTQSPVSHDSFTTPSPLPHHSLTTPHHSLTTTSQLSHDSFTTPSPLPDQSLLTPTLSPLPQFLTPTNGSHKQTGAKASAVHGRKWLAVFQKKCAKNAPKSAHPSLPSGDFFSLKRERCRRFPLNRRLSAFQA